MLEVVQLKKMISFGDYELVKFVPVLRCRWLLGAWETEYEKTHNCFFLNHLKRIFWLKDTGLCRLKPLHKFYSNNRLHMLTYCPPYALRRLFGFALLVFYEHGSVQFLLNLYRPVSPHLLSSLTDEQERGVPNHPHSRACRVMNTKRTPRMRPENEYRAMRLPDIYDRSKTCKSSHMEG